MHTDPLVVDASKLSATGYRYEVTKDGGVDADGRQCYDFRIDNVLLAPTWADTRDAGNPDGGPDLPRLGAGWNDIYVAYTTKPSDDPNGRTLVRQYRTRLMRYPVGGIKSPVDGVIHINPEDFVLGCGPQQTSPSP